MTTWRAREQDHTVRSDGRPGITHGGGNASAPMPCPCGPKIDLRRALVIRDKLRDLVAAKPRRDVAEQLGVSESFVSMVLNGLRAPTVRMARALGVEPMTDAESILTYVGRHVPCGLRDDQCWLWSGSKNSDGYGVVNATLDDGTRFRKYAHRLVYQVLVGPIPEGVTVDHKCFNPTCVNPAHLQLLSRADNSAKTRRRTDTCPRGHKYQRRDITPKGHLHQRCLICRAARARARNAERKARHDAL